MRQDAKRAASNASGAQGERGETERKVFFLLMQGFSPTGKDSLSALGRESKYGA